MSGERFIVKSSGFAVAGSEFKLTLQPTGDDELEATQAAHSVENETQPSTQEDNGGEFDEKFFGLFKSVAGNDLQVDAFELQSVVGQIFKKDFGIVKQFSIECCRSLIVMADMDRSGKLDFVQFKKLFNWIMDMRKVYKSYENDQSWEMDSRDLKKAMHELSYDLRQETIELIAMKYRNRQLRINFDDFLQICTRLKSCHDSFESYQIVGNTFDEFVLHMIYT